MFVKTIDTVTGIRAVAFLIAAQIAGSCVAQFEPAGTLPIVVNAEASVEKSAERLRAIIPLKSRGKSIKEASASMDEIVAAAKITLLDLGADKDSLRTSKLAIDQATTAQHRRMRQQMRGMGSGFFSVADEGEEVADANMIMVRRNLVAEWPLKSTGVELLQQIFDLQNSITETQFDTSGDDEMSAEEAELLEEAEMFSYEEGAVDDTPVVVFMASISQEEFDTLQKQAYQQANQKAKQMSKLTGRPIGRLALVREAGADATSYRYSSYAYQEEYGANAKVMAEFLNSDSPLVVIGKDAQALKFSSGITLGYEFAD